MYILLGLLISGSFIDAFNFCLMVMMHFFTYMHFSSLHFIPMTLSDFSFFGNRDMRSILSTFFYTQYKSYNGKITYNTTYKLLYNTSKTVPGGATDYDYPLAFNMVLKIHLKYYIQSARYKEKQKTLLRINT